MPEAARKPEAAGEPEAPSNLRVGPAGWSYDDWEGIVYPARKPKGFDALAYLADYFDVIEINSTFYRAPAAKAAASWVRRTAGNRRFKFTLKLQQKFTHERRGITEQDESDFRHGIEPIVEAGKLGCVLMQFPWSFKFFPESSLYLKRLIDRFKDYPLVLEVRNATWDNAVVYETLAERGVGFCNIDQPLFRGQLRPTELVTSQIGYIRLHGQNAEHWFKEDAGRDERYNYYYSIDELRPWIERIRAVAEKTKETYVVTNNHFQGQAVANALQLKFLVRDECVPTPLSMHDRFPELKGISTTQAPQERLF
jgi:uncharacterized protein YecE (DUF72 family)